MWGTCGRPQLPHTNTYRGAIVGAHNCPTFQKVPWGNCGRPQVPWGTCGRPQVPHGVGHLWALKTVTSIKILISPLFFHGSL